MARSRLSDYLQVFPFWLVDVSPSSNPPFFAFSPVSSFSSISAPSINIEHQDITECNNVAPRKVVKSIEYQPITLTRGVTFQDSDFMRWVVDAVNGYGKIRRDLMLIHFFNISINANVSGSQELLAALGIGSITALGAGLAGGGIGEIAAVSATYGVTSLVGGIEGGRNFGMFDTAPRIPAKAWMLYDCLPVSFRGASDFDASSGDVSLQELEIQPESFEVVDLLS